MNINTVGRRLFVEPKEVISDVRRGLIAGNERFLKSRQSRRLTVKNASNKPVIFVWIPKTAGTSVFTAFEQHGGQKLLTTKEVGRCFRNVGWVTFGHMWVPALLSGGLVSSHFFREAYKFAIVRNPFDRAVSLFEYLRGTGHLPKTMPFDLFCALLERGAYEDIGPYNHKGLNQLNPQSKWLQDETSNLFVDDIFRLEDLAASWPKIWESAGMPGRPPVVATLNRSKRLSVANYFTQELIEIVRRVYGEDFKLFNYSEEPEWQ